MGVSVMQRLARSGAVIGLGDAGDLLLREQSASASDRMPVCAGCTQGKSHRQPLGKGKPPEWSRATRPMDRWEVDLVGPFPSSLGGNRYALVAVDCYSSKTMIACIQAKSDAARILREWHAAAKNYHGRPLVEIHSDGGGEFVSNDQLEFWSSEGVKVTTTTPHTPVHNGRAERRIRTAIEDCRSLLYHARAPIELWGEAMKASAHLRNMLNVANGHTKTPNQLWHRGGDGNAAMIEKVDHLRVLFCDAWVHVPDADRTKLDAKSRLCLFIGYDDTTLGYRFLDVNTTPHRVIKSLDAVFDEKQFTQCELLRHHLLTGDNGGSSRKMSSEEYDEYLDATFNESALKLGMFMSEQHASSSSPPPAPTRGPTATTKTVRFGEDSISIFDDDDASYLSDDDESSYAPSEVLPLNPQIDAIRTRPARERRGVFRYGMVDMADVVHGNAVKKIAANTPAYGDPLTFVQMQSAPDASEFEKAVDSENASLIEKGVMVEVKWSDLPRGIRPIPTKY